MATESIKNDSVLIKCGNKSAEFYPGKLKKTGRSISKCIKYQDKWFNPPEFESLAGLQTKKWRQSIMVGGKKIGDWLSTYYSNQSVLESSTSVDAQCSNTQLPDNKSMDSDCSTITELTNSSQLSEDHQALSQNTPQTTQDRFPLSNPDLDNMIKSLEDKLLASMRELVHKAIENMKKCFESQIQNLTKQVEALTTRIDKLEEAHSSNTVAPTPNHGISPQLESRVPSPDTTPSVSAIHDQFENISRTLSNQQRIIEANEKVRREKNVIIMGVKESDVDTEVLVKDLITTKLNLSDVEITNARRLGKQNKNPRPVLVVFDSVESKRKVMRNRTKLLGSKIYINNDLTLDQRKKEKELRKKKQFLIKHELYRNKNITIYKGKLWADRVQVTDTELETAGFSL